MVVWERVVRAMGRDLICRSRKSQIRREEEEVEDEEGVEAGGRKRKEMGEDGGPFMVEGKQCPLRPLPKWASMATSDWQQGTSLLDQKKTGLNGPGPERRVSESRYHWLVPVLHPQRRRFAALGGRASMPP
jgi:hypothetical protein